MRTPSGLGMVATAATFCGAALVIALSGPAFAWKGDLEAEPLHESRGAAAGRQLPAGTREIPTGEDTLCAKCHSACEEGKTHQGLPPIALPAGARLPQTKEGRMACFTCHATHGSGKAQGSALLRMSNLRRELCLVCHDRGSDEGLRIRVVSPPDRSVIPESRLALIGTTSARVQGPLAVRLNDAESPLTIRGNAFFTWLGLQDGVNRIEIVQGQRVLWEGEVFRGESAAKGYGRSTLGHCTDSREECLGCHDEKGEKLAAAASDPSRLCYDCHDRYEGKRYVHGPFAVGACLACHDPHRGYGTAHLREEQTILCGNCHAPRETAATAACRTSGKACADCHDPHQSDSRFLL